MAFGPGSQGYVDQLKAYDDAFAAFFARLAASGIDRNNTLFVFAVDEGDHFVGVRKTGCDGVNTPCDYGPTEVGEINANIDTLVQHQFAPALSSQFLGSGAPNAFTVRGDDAPTFYLARKGAGPLAQTDPLTRGFERGVAKLTAVNPYTGMTDNLLVRMADQTGMKALHMFSAGDPQRNATFVFFANADYFLTDFPASTCETCINPAFAWNHGDIQPEIATTWVGLVGPGVRHQGVRGDIWTDHADLRPTMLALLGLEDPYTHDGRVVIDALDQDVEPHALRAHHETLGRLGAVYKQLNAPFGRFAKDALTVSTMALASGDDTSDDVYAKLQAEVAAMTVERDSLATRMKNALSMAAFGGQALEEREALRLILDGDLLIGRMSNLAQLHH